MRRALTIVRRAIAAFGVLFVLALTVAAVGVIAGAGHSHALSWHQSRSSDG